VFVEKRFSASARCVNVLGVNAVFRDPATGLVMDGVTVAAAEEARFTRLTPRHAGWSHEQSGGTRLNMARAVALNRVVNARLLRERRAPPPPLAVLVDRDGTLIYDVPFNGDPDLVLPMPGVRGALDRLRARGIPVAIVSNQSGIARGLLSPAQVEAVTERVAERLGPFAGARWCPHVEADRCPCRKPEPGLLLATAQALGVHPLRCAMIGDIGADVEAARAAGMRSVLVPTPATRASEIAAAPERAVSFAAAVDLLLRAPATPPLPEPRAAGASSAHVQAAA
jgi:HAD superfamily hydrolase (TIGR01662 family)